MIKTSPSIQLTLFRQLTIAATLIACLSGVVSFIFGYGHFFVFISLAAVGVGLQIIADRAESLPAKISDYSTQYALMCVAIPTAI